MSNRTTGILLAAGEGLRFSPNGRYNKLMMALPDGTPIALASLYALQASVGHVIAVVRPHATTLSEILRNAGAEVLVCRNADEGMGHSLACVAQRCLHGPTDCVVALADMPWVQSETIDALVDALEYAPIVAPMYHERRGQPVGFSSALLPAIARLEGDLGARALLERYGFHGVECNDPGVLRDVDEPTDLAVLFDATFTKSLQTLQVAA
ncbi:MAG TPA: nucleotidyltransferase family protein [Rhodocyclaceae bacterium]|nr:nucleotidyltransferase family protein [Rhodocyclaceae bacterium]